MTEAGNITQQQCLYTPVSPEWPMAPLGFIGHKEPFEHRPLASSPSPQNKHSSCPGLRLRASESPWDAGQGPAGRGQALSGHLEGSNAHVPPSSPGILRLHQDRPSTPISCFGWGLSRPRGLLGKWGQKCYNTNLSPGHTPATYQHYQQVL